MVTNLAETTVVARKAHQCQLCLLVIAKGEAHLTQRNADETQIWTWRAHSECYRLLNDYWRWCGYELREVDDEFTVDDAEFRAFLQTMHSASDPDLDTSTKEER